MAERKIQKAASNIFSLGEFNVFNEINRRKANIKNTLDNTILVFFKIVGNKSTKIRNKNMAKLSFLVSEFLREMKFIKKNESKSKTKTTDRSNSKCNVNTSFLGEKLNKTKQIISIKATNA